MKSMVLEEISLDMTIYGTNVPISNKIELWCQLSSGLCYWMDKARKLPIPAIDPVPNNTIKGLDINFNCMKEGAVNYLMKKFQGLEQVAIDVRELNQKLPKQLVTDLLQYISDVPKYFSWGYVDKGDKSHTTQVSLL